MTDLALAATGLLCLVALIRRPATARKPDQLMPAFGTCANCDRHVPLLATGGRCCLCGSEHVVTAWSYGAKLILRERARSERRRFIRAGTPERRRA